jgi:hypothetical protein
MTFRVLFDLRGETARRRLRLFAYTRAALAATAIGTAAFVPLLECHFARVRCLGSAKSAETP